MSEGATGDVDARGDGDQAGCCRVKSISRGAINEQTQDGVGWDRMDKTRHDTIGMTALLLDEG